MSHRSEVVNKCVLSDERVLSIKSFMSLFSYLSSYMGIPVFVLFACVNPMPNLVKIDHSCKELQTEMLSYVEFNDARYSG